MTIRADVTLNLIRNLSAGKDSKINITVFFTLFCIVKTFIYICAEIKKTAAMQNVWKVDENYKKNVAKNLAVSAPPRFLARRLWYSVSNAQNSEVRNFKPFPPRYETGRSGGNSIIKNEYKQLETSINRSAGGIKSKSKWEG